MPTAQCHRAVARVSALPSPSVPLDQDQGSHRWQVWGCPAAVLSAHSDQRSGNSTHVTYVRCQSTHTSWAAAHTQGGHTGSMVSSAVSKS